MVLVIAEKRVIKLPRALSIFCCNLMEVEMKVFVVSFLGSCMTEFDPEVRLLQLIEWFRRGSYARRNREWRLSQGRRGANLRHIVQRFNTRRADGVATGIAVNAIVAKEIQMPITYRVTYHGSHGWASRP